MSRAQGFPPIADGDAEILILGSMPGQRSLAENRYYAHPQNLFWRIMGELLDFDPAMNYARRVRALRAARIGLWDVLDSCVRPGSLDADIDAASAEANDFVEFFRRHPRITRVYFNGATAEAYYRRRALPVLHDRVLRYVRLPSTSPAHAAMTYERKREAWRAILTD